MAGDHIHNPQPTSAVSVSPQEEQGSMDHSLAHQFIYSLSKRQAEGLWWARLFKRFCLGEKQIGSPPISNLLDMESISHLLLPYCWLCLGCNAKCHRMSVLNNRHLFVNSSGDWGIQTQSFSHSFSEDRSPPAIQTAAFLILHMEHVQ